MLPMRQNLDPEFISPSRIKKPERKKGKNKKVEEVSVAKASDRDEVEKTFKKLMKHNSLQVKAGTNYTLQTKIDFILQKMGSGGEQQQQDLMNLMKQTQK